jgi:hypothetical protein
MKTPTLQGWLAIVGALLAVILAIIGALADRSISREEADDISAKTDKLIGVVQAETAETTPEEAE